MPMITALAQVWSGEEGQACSLAPGTQDEGSQDEGSQDERTPNRRSRRPISRCGRSLRKMVRTAGLEPTTSCSGGKRSIRLSYARTLKRW